MPGSCEHRNGSLGSTTDGLFRNYLVLSRGTLLRATQLVTVIAESSKVEATPAPLPKCGDYGI
jgi:hypothetical protein